jgi:hypothetical protein
VPAIDEGWVSEPMKSGEKSTYRCEFSYVIVNPGIWTSGTHREENHACRSFRCVASYSARGGAAPRVAGRADWAVSWSRAALDEGRRRGQAKEEKEEKEEQSATITAARSTDGHITATTV